MPTADPSDLTANLGWGGSGYTPPPVDLGSRADDSRRSLDSSESDADDQEAQPADRPAEAPRRLGPPQGEDRYLPGDELGRGGWGRVERARDRQLERDVAVKRINRELAESSAIHERFFHEARVTGQLQHPGVVPVHELGVGEDGAPYYVMKLLEGVTFKETIRAVHARPEGCAGGYSVELLDRFCDICNAVAYAHQQGVLHRDLKPSNIMVGQFGETIVVDWGLAQAIEEAPENVAELTTMAQGEPAASSPPTRRRAKNTAVGRSGGSGGSRSSRGVVVGTPAYMSPEQSHGEVGSLAPATDIYALGVILYEVLTGANPFRSGDVETTLSRVRAGEYKPPRAVNARVPRALAAICTTAMAREPGARYERAEQIVEDVQRFLAGEAVGVYRDPLWARLNRWRRRHPALSAGLLGSATVLTVATIVGGALVQHAQKAELRARLAALDRLAESREAGDAWLIDLSGSLQFFPGMGGLRRELLEQGVTHYERLLTGLDASAATGPAAALERAKCQLRLGDLQRLLEEKGASRSHYQAALATLTPLDGAALGDDAWAVRAELANARIGLTLLDGEGDLAADARWLRTQLDASLGPEQRRQVANTAARLAIATVRADQIAGDGAVDLLVEAQQHGEQLVAERGEPRDHQLLQVVRDELAPLLRGAGRLDDAAAVWTAEVERLGTLVAGQTQRPDLLQSLAYARMQLAGLRLEARDDAAAAEQYRGAIADLDAAWRLSDADAYYRRNVAASHASLGRVVFDADTAQQHLTEAIDHLRHAASVEGPSAGDLTRLAECYEALGRIARLRGDDTATRHLDAAEQCFTVLADHGRTTAELQARRAQTLAERALARQDRGDLRGALEDAVRGATLVELALANGSISPAARDAAVLLHTDLLAVQSELLAADGQQDQAVALSQQATTALRTLAETERTRGDTGAYPIAMQRLFDRLVERDGGAPAELAEAAGWLEAMANAHPGCRDAAEWRQRTALAHWLRDEPGLTAEAARAAIEMAPGDRMNQLLQAAGDGAAAPEAARLVDEAPGDRRLRHWARRLAPPQG